MLNLKTIAKIIGALLGLEALLMSVCLCVSLLYQDKDIIAFIWSILITIVAGGAFRLMGRHANNTISRRDAYFVVAVTWIIFSLFGTLPFSVYILLQIYGNSLIYQNKALKISIGEYPSQSG